jgi:hypothetical protein
MRSSSRKPAMFITLMAASGLSIVIKGVLDMHPLHQFQFLSLLALAMLTSRMKVRLPGLTGNMSVNLPFLFVAIVQLSLIEASLIAFASTLVQSMPKAGKPLNLTQVLFNVSTVTTAAGFAFMVFKNHAWGHGSHGPLSLLLAASTYFFINTLPVATIIALTEGAKITRTWLGIMHLAFPYYVAGTGITSLATGNGSYMAWALPLVVLPVMFGIYRSYRAYFAEASAGTPAPDRNVTPLARTKAVGAV